jgi:hypothetical protein
MSMTAPECPVCRVRMEEGHVLDWRDGSKQQRVTWIEGPPEKGVFGFRTKGKRQIPVVTWRCPGCGWLLWFAPKPEE